MEAAGEVGVVLDTDGRLRSFLALPPQTGAAEAAAPDWTIPFAEAGIDSSHWTRTTPERDPLFHADTVAAWTGSLADYPGVPLRIEAAARRGKIRMHRLLGGALAVLLVGALAAGSGANILVGAPTFVLIIAMMAFVLYRFGLFAAIVGNFVGQVVSRYPITFHASAWYASAGYAGLVLLAAIAVYGFRMSLGGRPILNEAGFDG